MLWWVTVLWIAKAAAEQNCPLGCRCPRPMEIDCSDSGHLTLDPSLLSGPSVRQTRSLYLHKNRLTAVDRDLLAWLGQLRILTLHDNLLMSLSSEAFSGQRNLEMLTLHGNALAVLPPNLFYSIISLKVLTLGSNRLNTVHPEQFANNILLESLDLSSNELHSMPANFLSFNSRLIELLLNDNYLGTLPEHCLDPVIDSLKMLDLSGNHWLQPPPLSRFNVLDTLTLSRCNITDFPELPTTIKKLDLSFNLFRDIPDSLPQKIETLNLEANRLETLPDAKTFPESLRNLSISYNRLCKLSALPSSLQFLWLDHIDLKSPINSNIFVGSTQLRFINLEGNQLTSPLGNDVFKSQRILSTLVLADNCLSTLDPKDFAPMKGLRVLNVSNNPLHCDCGVKNTLEWARGREIAIVPEICDSKPWDEHQEELDCRLTTSGITSTSAIIITTLRSSTTAATTTIATTITAAAAAATATTSASNRNYEQLESLPSSGNLMWNQSKQNTSAYGRKVCSVLMIISMIATKVQ